MRALRSAMRGIRDRIGVWTVINGDTIFEDAATTDYSNYGPQHIGLNIEALQAGQTVEIKELCMQRTD